MKKALESLPRKKTSQFERLIQYIQYVLSCLDLLLSFHIKKDYRDLKFTRYIGRQKALQKLCNHITAKAGRNTLVGFGDWSNKDSAGIIKKCPAGPVKQLERELKKRCTVVSVDEFRTSKLHECCHQPLKVTRHVRKCRDGKVRSVQVRSVLFCANRSCNGMCVNRDVNASRNILALLKSQLSEGVRPTPFCRETLVSTTARPVPPAPSGGVGSAGVGQGLRNPPQGLGYVILPHHYYPNPGMT